MLVRIERRFIFAAIFISQLNYSANIFGTPFVDSVRREFPNYEEER